MNRISSHIRSALGEIVGDLGVEVRSLPAFQWIALGILCVAGAALRIKYLFIPMRYDEAQTYSIYAFQRTTAFMRDYSEPNNHIFHTLLVHFSTKLFGPSEWAIRLPALCAGILLIPVAAFVFRRLFNAAAGLLSAAMIAGSSILIEYSINARGYSIQVLFFVILLGLASYLHRRTNLVGWIVFVVLSALGFYTIPTMLYPFGVLMGWMLLMTIFVPGASDLRTTIVRIFAAGFATIALTLVFYSPVIISHGLKPLMGNQWVTALTWRQFLQGWPSSLHRIWYQWNRGLPIALGVALSAGVILYFLIGRDFNRRRIACLTVALLGCPLAVCLQRVIPFSRVWMFLVPLYLALAAAGYVAAARPLLQSVIARYRWMAIVGPALLLLAISVPVIRSHSVEISGEALPAAREIATYVDGNLQDGDQILGMFPTDMPILYYDQQPPKLRRAMLQMFGKSHRVLIVIRPSDQTPDDVLRHHELNPADYDPPQLIRVFDGASIYQTWHRASS